MHKILNKKELNKEVFLLEVETPRVIKNAKPGQFVILIIDEKGERIPITIFNAHPERKSVELIIQKIGASTCRLSGLKRGDSILSITGPLGHPAPIENFGKVIYIGGGVGIEEMYPVVKAINKK